LRANGLKFPESLDKTAGCPGSGAIGAKACS
jgi:hypothetical protein